MRLPSELAQAAEREIASADSRALARDAVGISSRYRGQCRKQGGHSPKHHESLDPVESAAYLAVRLPATFAAAGAALRATKAQLPEIKISSLLDLGAGPGTAAWAAREIFPEIERIEFMEKNARILELGKRLARDAKHGALRAARWRQADFCNLGDGNALGQHDLVIAAYALGEAPIAKQAGVVEAAWKNTAKLLVVVEPGTPRGYQTVLRARDLLIAMGGHIVAPCPHDGACPMSAIPGEWCHFAQRLERTRLHRRLKSAELGYEDEKYSYVAVARGQATPAAARIVRHPRVAAGKITLSLCARLGLEEITITRSEKEWFRAARRAKWGDAWP